MASVTYRHKRKEGEILYLQSTSYSVSTVITRDTGHTLHDHKINSWNLDSLINNSSLSCRQEHQNNFTNQGESTSELETRSQTSEN